MKADGTNQSWRSRERAEMQQRGGSQRQVKQTSGDGQAVSTHRPYIDGERARLETKIFFDGIYYIIKGVLKEATTFAERVQKFPRKSKKEKDLNIRFNEDPTV